LTSTTTAHYSILEVCWPGAAADNAGILLVDPESGRARVRLRRDWEEIIDDEDDREVFSLLQEDLNRWMEETSPAEVLQTLEDRLSNVLRISEREAVAADDFDRTLNRLYNRHIQSNVIPFRTHLPLYSLRAAAGGYGEDRAVNQEDWVEVPAGLPLSEDQFVAYVDGDSMEPLIPAGSLCVFRQPRAGSRHGRIVLVQHFGTVEGGGETTVKRWRSEKIQSEEGWSHERIIMEPLNQPKHQPWLLSPEQQETLRVIGEFVRVL
jgi:phage repressor protein C with HTH and peptisase S24 domain